MPDPIPNTNNNQDPANPGGDNKNNLNNDNKGGDGGSGADPTKTEPTGTQAFDPSKIGDDDFDKVFEDPRVWKHPRFKSLNDRAKKADEYEKAEKAREEQELEKKGKHEELAKKAQEERDEWQKKYTQSQVNNSIQAEAAKLGVVDLEAVLKLINRDSITVGDDGTVSGAEDAVKALLESKPYLKGKAGQVKLGSPTNPGENTDNIKRFKLSQIQDPTFYRENEKDIMAAMKAGLIEDDIKQGQQA